MSHIWNKQADGTWKDYALGAEPVQLTRVGPVPLASREQLGAVSGPVLLPSQDSLGDEQRVLMCKPDSPTRVNGRPVDIGARVLADRDAITLDAGPTLYFSSERRAEIVDFVGEGKHANCVRCKLPLEPGTLAVRCPAPGCGFWHHERPDSPCWTYAEGCAACGHPTDLNAGFQWSPEEL